MKKAFLFSGIFLFLLAITTFVAFKPFTGTKEAKQPAVRWFYYNDSATDPSNPANYTLIPAGQTPDCEGEGRLCAIQAALNSSTNQPIDPAHPMASREKDPVE